jgi:hypothetical protein
VPYSSYPTFSFFFLFLEIRSRAAPTGSLVIPFYVPAVNFTVNLIRIFDDVILDTGKRHTSVPFTDLKNLKRIHRSICVLKMTSYGIAADADSASGQVAEKPA